MTSKLTDIGVNLLHPQYAPDLSSVIQRARAAGVSRLLVTSTNLEETAAAIALCQRHGPGLWCTAGVHPHEAGSSANQGWEIQLGELTKHTCVKAIGETGLDFYRSFSPRDKQIEVFRTQLAIAVGTGLPVFVHDRESNGTVARLLDEQAGGLSGVVIHCFTGTREDLLSYLNAGYYIGITGWICDRKRGARLRELAPLIPLNRLLVETDGPFLRPHNAPKDAIAVAKTIQARRNEPALLSYVIEQLAQLFECSPEQIAAASSHNAENLFQLVD